MKVYFVRHGESQANLLREFSNTGIKHPLTEQGLAQAQQTAKNLTGLGVVRVYSSPLLRARQTAQIIAERLIVPLEITEALREWDVGVYEGKCDPEGWRLHRQVQEDWFFKGQLDSKMLGGESFLDIQARLVPFIDELLQAQGGENQKFVLVGHGGLYIAMLPVIVKNVDHSFAFQHSLAYTDFAVAENRPDGLHCVSWGAIPIK